MCRLIVKSREAPSKTISQQADLLEGEALLKCRGRLYRVLSGMEGMGIFILTFPDLIGTPVDGEEFYTRLCG
jgi:hypothetical protein